MRKSITSILGRLSAAAALFALAGGAAIAQDAGGFGTSSGGGSPAGFGSSSAVGGWAVGGSSWGSIGSAGGVTGDLGAIFSLDSASVWQTDATTALPSTDRNGQADLTLTGIDVSLPPDMQQVVLLQALQGGDFAAPGYGFPLQDLPIVSSPGLPIPLPGDYPPLFDTSGLSPIDLLKMIVGPEGASGAILGGFTGASALAAGWTGVPPSIQALREQAQAGYAKRCQAAVDGLLPFRGDHYEGCTGTAATLAQCRAALESYVNQCLADPNQPPDVAAANDAPPQLSAETLKQVAAVSGILYQAPDGAGTSGQIFCTASRIARDLLVTARHCVFRKTTAAEAGTLGSQTLRDLGGIRFFAFGAPTEAIRVTLKLDPFGTDRPWAYLPDDVSSDYVFLEIEPPEDEPALPQLSEPRLWDRVVLFSYAYGKRLSVGATLSDAQMVADGSWVHLMGYDASDTCVVAAMPRPNCLAYPCQSEVGSSGAPLFRVSGDKLELVGIHVQHIVPGSPDPCTNPKVAALVNVGVWLRPQDLQMAQAQQ